MVGETSEKARTPPEPGGVLGRPGDILSTHDEFHETDFMRGRRADVVAPDVYVRTLRGLAQSPYHSEFAAQL